MAFRSWAFFFRYIWQINGTPNVTLILLFWVVSQFTRIKCLLLGILFRMSFRISLTVGSACCDARAKGQRGEEEAIYMFFVVHLHMQAGLNVNVNRRTYFSKYISQSYLTLLIWLIYDRKQKSEPEVRWECSYQHWDHVCLHFLHPSIRSSPLFSMTFRGVSHMDIGGSSPYLALMFLYKEPTTWLCRSVFAVPAWILHSATMCWTVSVALLHSLHTGSCLMW